MGFLAKLFGASRKRQGRLRPRDVDAATLASLASRASVEPELLLQALERLASHARLTDEVEAHARRGVGLWVARAKVQLMDEAQLRESLPWLAEEHMPIDTKRVAVDSIELARGEDEMDILIVVVQTH